MYKKERYSFYILFTLKAACGLAYRPQAAFAFDRYLSSSQLLVWLHRGGPRRGYAPSMQHQPRSRDAVVLATLPRLRIHAMACACAGGGWGEVVALQGASRLEQAAELFFVRYSSYIPVANPRHAGVPAPIPTLPMNRACMCPVCFSFRYPK